MQCNKRERVYAYIVLNKVSVILKKSVISDVRVTWERVSQKLNILTAWRRGPRVAIG